MESRIQKSLMNAKVNVLFYILITILAFFSRKYFLQNLGTEFVGLSGTLGDILNLMNITELGIGTAVSVTLYKPLFNKDHNTINDIVSVYGFLYSRVGLFIGTVGLIISAFFPVFFKDAGVPLYFVYMMFYAMLYAALLGYFINYKQIILSASQQNYVIMLRYNTTIIAKVILQIITSFLPYNYIWWILLEAITITVYTFLINGTIRKHFPWLESSYSRGKEKFSEYKDLWNKTKQVFCLKVSHVVFNSSSNVLIYTFTSLTTVALYGSYQMLMTKVTAFVDGLFTGMEASVGNLIAEGDIVKIKRVFNELLSIRYFFAGVCSITLYFTVSPFINVWLGSEYIMGDSLVVLLSLHIFFQQARLTVDNFKNGYGIYQDVWAPISEVVLFIGLALLLGKFYGLAGILFAQVFTEGLVKMTWKPYYLFKKGFQQSVLKYYWPLIIKYVFIYAVTILLCTLLQNYYMTKIQPEGWLMMLTYCVAMGASVVIMLFMFFLILDTNFKGFINRLKSYRK